MSTESEFPDFSELLSKVSKVEVEEDTTKQIPVSKEEKELIDKVIVVNCVDVIWLYKRSK